MNFSVLLEMWFWTLLDLIMSLIFQPS